MNEFHEFTMERMMSEWENTVELNLSESGVQPLKLGELLELGGVSIDQLLDVELGYPQTNGLDRLRETIANLYEGANADNVIVTVGAAEANYLAVSTLLAPGDEMVIVLPNYMQVDGIARNIGARVLAVPLDAKRDWSLDAQRLEECVSSRTKLIAVCNPNNPTGRILTEAEMDAVVKVAARAGAWLLADEVYRGAERETTAETPSFFGRYERVIAQGSMSKAYGLPGLRLGWSVAPPAMIEAIWRRHEYTTIASTMLSNRLATIALSEDVRPRILARTRALIRDGFDELSAWAEDSDGRVELSRTQAAAIAFVRYRAKVNSTSLADRLRLERSVLVVPGDHFGLDGYLRISFGLPAERVREGLSRIGELLDDAEARGEAASART